MDRYQAERRKDYAAYIQANTRVKAQKPSLNGAKSTLVEKHSKDAAYRPEIKDSGGAGDRPTYDKTYAKNALVRENWREDYDRPLDLSVPAITCKMPLRKSNDLQKGKSAASVCGSQHSSDSRRSHLSSKGLRKIVKSQCKLHEEITSLLEDVTLYAQRENIITSGVKVEVAPTQTSISHREENFNFYAPSTSQAAAKMNIKEVPQSFSQDVNGNIPYYEVPKASMISPKPETMPHAEAAREAIYQLVREPRGISTSEVNISLEDLVQSRIINPLMKKCCRMYMNCMSSEVAIMEDLEHMSQNIDQLYKNTFFTKSSNNNNNNNNTTYDMSP